MDVVKIENKYWDSNSYVIIKDNNCLIVDPSFEPLKIVKYINDNDLTPIGCLITHCHNDHIYGVDIIKENYNIDFYMSSICNEGMKDEFINLSYNEKNIIRVDVDYINLEDNKTYSIKDFNFKVVSVPGHSLGCLLFEFDNFLITGDFLFKRCVGKVTYDSSSYDDMISSINKFKELYSDKDLMVYPGHRENTDIQTEINTNPFLKRPKSIKFLS